MYRRILCMLSLILTVTTTTVNAASDEPIITLKTHRYETMGADNQIQISLMASPAAKTTEIEADFGYGRKKFTLRYDSQVGEDEEEETLIGGTTVSGAVGPEGVVRIYGDASKIDYLDVHGSQVYDIDISRMTELTILSLAHNEIEKLDVSHMTKLNYLDLKDNPFNQGLIIGDNHLQLYFLCINQIGDKALASGTVDISCFPALRIFTAWDAKSLKRIDPSQNKYLMQLSVDNSGITDIDVTNNPYLQILNVSDCGLNKLDVTKNEYLVELYCDNEGRASYRQKLNEIDVTHNPHLQRLFCQGNNLRTIDLSNVPNLISLYAANNHINSIDVSKIRELAYLDLSVNDLDFATLPDHDPMTYFYYTLQHDMQVEKEYGAGMQLDLSHRVLRQGTTTTCRVFSSDINDVELPVELEPGKDYTYADGVITFLTPQTDNVFCQFRNDVFDGVTLETTRFKVRSAEEYGKPVELFSITPASAGQPVNAVFTTAADETLFVDYGDGKVQSITAKAGEDIHLNGLTTSDNNLTSSNNGLINRENNLTSETTNLASRKISVSAKIGAAIASLRISDSPLAAVDLTKATELTSLSITGCELKDIDLSWNNKLQSLILDGNNLEKLDLTGVSNGYHKNLLERVSARSNGMKTFDYGMAASTITSLDLSDNDLTDVNLYDLTGVKDLNLSNNQLATLDFTKCYSLEHLNIDGNNLRTLANTNIETPGGMFLKSVSVKNNLLRYSTMPVPESLSWAIDLAPQRDIIIAEQTYTIDLKTENSVNGHVTTFSVRDADSGKAYEEGVDFTNNGGIIRFLPTLEGKNVYCQMENEAFPTLSGDNALRTTTTLASSAMKYLIGQFHTGLGTDNGILSIAANEPNTYIYIDWGDGDMKEYELQTEYQLFQAKTSINKDVKIYSNTSADGNMKVFSVEGVPMTSIDVSPMKNLYCLTVKNAGLNDIDVKPFAHLGELNLEGNNLTSVDLSNNTEITFLVLAHNQFTTIDLAKNTNLMWLVANDNIISEFNGTKFPNLNVLDLTRNCITDIDLSTMPQLGQLSLAENMLDHLDLSKNKNIVVIDLSSNMFKFSTLPANIYNVYFYGNQKPLDVACVDNKVDISSESIINGTPSSYYWFDGPIEFYYDADDNLQLWNEEYIEGTDFTVKNGVTSFVAPHNQVTGLITNEEFPSLLLYTKTIAVTADPDALDGIRNVTSDALDSDAPRYNINGQRVTAAHKGIIIQNGRKQAIKR